MLLESIICLLLSSVFFANCLRLLSDDYTTFSLLLISEISDKD